MAGPGRSARAWGLAGLAAVLLLAGLGLAQPEAIPEGDQHKLARRLHTAIASGNQDLAMVLINRYPELREARGEDGTPLNAAVVYGWDDLVEFLLFRHADLTAQDNYLGYTPLHTAAARCNLDIASLLIQKGADPRARALEGVAPLHAAAAGCDGKMAELLIASGSSVDITDEVGDAPLDIAAAHGNLKMAAALLDRGANVEHGNVIGETPLHSAASAGQLPMMEYLIGRGADVREKDLSGAMPIHVAGTPAVMRRLLREGFSVDEPTADRSTPLHFAALRGLEDVVWLLVARGADVNATNDSGETPLLRAVASGNPKVVEFLLAKGARVNVANREVLTPLHRAAYFGYVEIGRMLIAAGSEINPLDKKQRSPLTMALEEKQEAFAEMMRRHGGIESGPVTPDK
jgi:ankyrin repeat protein